MPPGVVLLAVLCKVSAVPPVDVLPFGYSNGDQGLPSADTVSVFGSSSGTNSVTWTTKTYCVTVSGRCTL